jgi:hypothetical protein
VTVNVSVPLEPELTARVIALSVTVTLTTAWLNAEEVDFAKVESPPYAAVIECTPAAKSEEE